VPKASTTRAKTYAEKHYQRYFIAIRRDDPLLDAVEDYKNAPENSLSALIRDLLAKHFGLVPANADEGENAILREEIAYLQQQIEAAAANSIVLLSAKTAAEREAAQVDMMHGLEEAGYRAQEEAQRLAPWQLIAKARAEGRMSVYREEYAILQNRLAPSPPSVSID